MSPALSEALQNQIAALIRAYIDGHSETDDASKKDLRVLARHLNALPICHSMTCSQLIRSNGDIISVDSIPPWGADTKWQRDTDALDRHFALVAGAEEFPVLQALLPQRTAAATDCAVCHGTGRVLPPLDRLRCGTCFGLGWTGPSVKLSWEIKK